ncbi:response regulator aspartate phosphatase [Geomicrobium sp. JCM 19037]|uniref:response regulator aspartate phosphatase n=1 Tax=Geomicrobium sp. JCM 19037 TaxID=1460634 RepID=UPI00045F4AB8|nr:hypothetical protein [Geomicrobium sp. JCM 19037]GAK03028.1 response regulator aspartate phosphatase [Geomicrobium sp. JCM 19037]
MEASTIVDFQKVLSNWYMAMVELDMPLAHKQKEEADFLMQHMSTDEKTKTYYRLIDFRYRVMTEASLQAPSQQTGVFQDSIRETDQVLQYLYAYMEGHYEFHNGRYKQAINFFEMAGNHLDGVRTEEKGEFYHRVGETYYRINQFTVALAYFDKALTLYESQNMSHRMIFSWLFTGAIYSELYLFDKAEHYYQKILVAGEERTNETQGLIKRAVALHRIRQEHFHEASILLEDSIELLSDYVIVQIKSKCNLANIYFRIGKVEAGTDLLLESEKLASKYGLTEYIARCLATRGLYIEEDLKFVDNAIEMLRSNKLFFEATEICEETSNYFVTENNFVFAYEYMKKANTFRINHQIIGDD